MKARSTPPLQAKQVPYGAAPAIHLSLNSGTDDKIFKLRIRAASQERDTAALRLKHRRPRSTTSELEGDINTLTLSSLAKWKSSMTGGA